MIQSVKHVAAVLGHLAVFEQGYLEFYDLFERIVTSALL